MMSDSSLTLTFNGVDDEEARALLAVHGFFNPCWSEVHNCDWRTHDTWSGICVLVDEIACRSADMATQAVDAPDDWGGAMHALIEFRNGADARFAAARATGTRDDTDGIPD